MALPKNIFSSIRGRVIADYPQNLDFGCGPNVKDGYVGVDIRKLPNIRYVCNAWDIGKHVKTSSVAEIYARHFFEHLTFDQADLTLAAWHQILAAGGIVQIIVPDIQYHIEQFLSPCPEDSSEANPEWTVMEHSLAGFWGWQNDGVTQTWDVHKSGYNFRLIEKKLLEHNFHQVNRCSDKPWNLNVTAKKL